MVSYATLFTNENIETKIMYFDILAYMILKYLPFQDHLYKTQLKTIFSIGWVASVMIYTFEDVNNIYLIFLPSSNNSLRNIMIYMLIFLIFFSESVKLIIANIGICDKDDENSLNFENEELIYIASVIFMSTYYVALLAF